ncbi:MAG: APC family permease, partial [Bryobacteraceae bacterium]
DYVVNPLICTIWCARAVENLLPFIPYAVTAVFFATLFTLLNLQGIQSTARTNEVLAAVMFAVIAWMLIAAARYVLHLPDLTAAKFLLPFYDPARFSVPAISTGTSVAVLTYIGFDAISTLSEEVKNPRRNILLATVMVCLIIGVLSAVEVYAAQLVWPASQPFPDVETAYMQVARRAGGDILFQALGITLIVATIGSGAGAQLAGARLLYGMGRDNALPRGFFGYLDPRSRVPSRNVILIGFVCLAGAFLMTYQLGAELLNFGALIGFMGVNLSVLIRYYIRKEDRRLTYLLPPAFGFLICFYLWISLSQPARIAGAVWMIVGILYGAYKTSGFRKAMLRFEAPAD